MVVFTLRQFRGPHTHVGFRVLGENGVHYFVYLDEFGHIGQFISRHHPSFKTSPVFGLGGIALPISEVRNFSMFFYKLKIQLLDFEIKKSGEHPSKWEKKGSDLYTFKNIERYRQLRQATNRLINKIKCIGGFAFFTGVEKEPPSPERIPEHLYYAILRDAIKRLDSYFSNNSATFSLFLDAVDSQDQGAKRRFRLKSIEAAGKSMFGSEHCLSLQEPPYQLESHLYQNLQCTDWFCGLFGRRYAFKTCPKEYSEFECVEKYFGSRLDTILRAHKLRRRQSAKIIHLPAILPHSTLPTL